MADSGVIGSRRCGTGQTVWHLRASILDADRGRAMEIGRAAPTKGLAHGRGQPAGDWNHFRNRAGDGVGIRRARGLGAGGGFPPWLASGFKRRPKLEPDSNDGGRRPCALRRVAACLMCRSGTVDRMGCAWMARFDAYRFAHPASAVHSSCGVAGCAARAHRRDRSWSVVEAGQATVSSATRRARSDGYGRICGRRESLAPASSCLRSSAAADSQVEPQSNRSAHTGALRRRI